MNIFARINDNVRCIGEFLKDYFLLILRLYWGWSFLSAGWGKFGNIQMVNEFFSSIQIPYPLFNAYLVATVETVGGFCLLVGLLSRLVSIPLAITMIVALLTAHLSETSAIFENPQRFINQLPFIYLLVCLIILCFGAGKFSLDYLLRKRFEKKEL